MGTAASPLGKPATDPTQLDDVELWHLAHSELPDILARDELFQRCLKRIKLVINAYVFAKHLCPPGKDRHAFAEDAIGVAEEKLIQSIGDLRSPEKLKGWLCKLARSAALEEYRKVVGRGKSRPIIEPEDHLDTEKGRQHARSPGSFRSRYWRDPSTLVRDREHVELLDLVLSIHAQGSKRDADSALWIKTKLEEDLEVDEIAKKRGTTKDDVWRLLAHDQRELHNILKDRLKLAVQDL